MKKILLLLICMNLLPFYIFAQQQKKWSPWASAEAGLLVGSYEPSGDLRGTLGFEKKDWAIGVGAGMDFYRFQSVPVVAQVRKTFTQSQWKPFAFASLGPSFNTQKGNTRDGGFITIWPSPSYDYQYKTGYYGELGAGYGFFNRKGNGLALSLSYSQKTTTESYDYSYWVDYGQGYKTLTSSTRYTMHRIGFRMGWKF